MAYVQRDPQTGAITGAFSGPQSGNPDVVEIDPADPLYVAWQDGQQQAQQKKVAFMAPLAGSDYQMARGFEELVPLLIAKGVISSKDLAPAALANLNARRAVRGLLPV